jgi:hypothetical protein
MLLVPPPVRAIPGPQAGLQLLDLGPTEHLPLGSCRCLSCAMCLRTGFASSMLFVLHACCHLSCDESCCMCLHAGFASGSLLCYVLCACMLGLQVVCVCAMGLLLLLVLVTRTTTTAAAFIGSANNNNSNNSNNIHRKC